MTEYEKDILDKYSNSSLRRNEPEKSVAPPKPLPVAEILAPRPSLSSELRALAREIETVCHNSRCSSLAYPAVMALTDYLTLRAQVIDYESRK